MNSESNMTVGEKGNTAPIQGHATPHEKRDYTKVTRKSLGVPDTIEAKEKQIDRERGSCLMLYGYDLRFMATFGSRVYTKVLVALFEWYTETKATLELDDTSRLFFEKLLKGHLTQTTKYAQKCETNRANGKKGGAKKQADSTPKQTPQS